MLYFLYNDEPCMTSANTIRSIEGIVFITKEEYEKKLAELKTE